MSITTELQVGVPTLVAQTTAYAMPPVICHITSTAAIEGSVDNTTFVALTNANTVGIFASVAFVRCTASTTCVVIVKKF